MIDCLLPQRLRVMKCPFEDRTVKKFNVTGGFCLTLGQSGRRWARGGLRGARREQESGDRDRRVPGKGMSKKAPARKSWKQEKENHSAAACEAICSSEPLRFILFHLHVRKTKATAAAL